MLRMDVAMMRVDFNFLTGKNRPFRLLNASFDTIEEAMNTVLKYYKMKAVTIPADIGNDAEAMEFILSASGLAKRDIELEGKWWNSFSGPLVAKTEEYGYMVLVKSLSAGYRYYDPKINKMRKVSKENYAMFGKTAAYFYKPLPPESLRIWVLLRFLLSSVSFLDTAAMVLAVAMSALFGLVLPIVSKYVYEIIIPSGNYHDILPVFMLLMGIALSSFVLAAAKRLSAEGIICKAKLAFESATFYRLLHLPYHFFKAYPSGELANYVCSVGFLCEAFLSVILTIVITAIFSCAYLIQIKMLVPELFPPTLLILLVLGLLIVLFVWYEYRLQKRNLKLSAELFGFVNQMIKGIEKIKLCGAEIFVFAQWAKGYNKKIKIFHGKRIFFLIEEAVFTVIVSLGALLFYYEASKRNISASSFIAFSIAYMAVVTVMVKLVQTAKEISVILPIVNSIMPIYQLESEGKAGKRKIIEPKGNIQIHNLSFAYENNDNPIINNISLEIKKDEYVGIVGETGCGKSTLLKLLLGLEKAKSGAIYYDEHDINDVDLMRLRQKIGTVMQNGKLIHDSIFENIVAGSSKISQEDVFAALKIAGIAEDINKMPMGLFTVIPESGGGLSEGQAQRILIARAIVNKPKILFFDEATSALDNTTQKIVISQIEKLDCTKIVIAHRLTTVKNCDKIVVVHQGKIVQQGSYSKLLSIEGMFKVLAKRQIM
ncbi:MAG: ATP-binding cassette domain-containing protein [Dehalobacterium sp.]